MKKRICIIIAIVFTLALCVSFTACNSGKSAYEIACENGFIGTEQEWLESLSGKDGQDGADLDIYDLFDAYLDTYPEATFEEFLRAYLTIDYHDIASASAKGIQSAVSVYCVFERSGRPSVSAAGSGVIYRISQNNVYIITNYHVIYYNNTYGNAKSIEVYSYGLETEKYAVQAQLAGGSITKDIAVLKASLSDFNSEVKPADLADSNDITLGERTVAIGNPAAEGISITSGIVSVDSEEIEMSALDTSGTNTMRVIRTDTPINSGNSGGGLYNSRGQLLGIVNAKSAESDIENIGFAIPVNVAAGIADCVIDNDFKKCQFGITIIANSYSTQYNSSKNRIEIIETLTVESVTAGALADEKIMAGDKLISVRIGSGNSLKLTRIFHLPDFLYKVRAGDTIYLEVERNSETVIIELKPAAGNFYLV